MTASRAALDFATVGLPASTDTRRTHVRTVKECHFLP
jgi:hypothetical protein